MIGVTYAVNGKILRDSEPVDTPFVVVDLVIAWWRLIAAFLRRERLTVRVVIDADPDTCLAVQDLLDCHPPGDTLLDATARVEVAEARAQAAREQLNRLLDAATAEDTSG